MIDWPETRLRFHLWLHRSWPFRVPAWLRSLDPQSIFGLATALDEVGTDEADEEADALYLRFIEEHPTSPMVSLFQHRKFRGPTVWGDAHLQI